MRSSKSSLEIAVDAACRVEHRLLQQGSLRQNQSIHQEEIFSTEFEINNYPIAIRNLLTKAITQEEIHCFSGALVSTRGRYTPNREEAQAKYKGEKPLHLHLQGRNKQSLDLALQRIESLIADTMEQPKFREKFLIGLESVPASFDVRGKVMGPGGANLQYITNETGAIVTVRGRGSGFIEPNTGQESVEPLHLCVEHSKYEVLQAGRQLAFNLIETVQQEWVNMQQQQQHHIPPIAIQLQQQPPPQMISGSGGGATAGDLSGMTAGGLVATSLTVPVFSHTQPVGQIVSVPPPGLAVPPPTLHIPHQQGPLQMGLPHHQQQNISALIQGPPPQLQQLQAGGQPQQQQQIPQPPDQQQQQQQQSQQQLQAQQQQQQAVQVSAQQQTDTPPPLPTSSTTSGVVPTSSSTPTSQHHIIQQPVYVSQQPVQTLQTSQQQQQVLTASAGPQAGTTTTLLPPASIVAAQQPQIVAQASYPLQYMQASTGQMVVAYPNIVRPGGEQQVAQQQQVMLLQYQQQHQQHQQLPTAAVRCQPQQRSTAVLGATTLLQPQIVQIVNPQTGQVQHVLQHVQQVPAQPQQQQQAAQQQQTAQATTLLVPQPPQLLAAAPHHLQFVQPQQMILTHPPQLSAAGLSTVTQQPPQQQPPPPAVTGATMLTLTSPQQQQSQPALINRAQQLPAPHQQGQKRRFEGDQNQFQNLPPQPVPPPTSTTNQQQQQSRKGIGSSGSSTSTTATTLNTVAGIVNSSGIQQQVGSTGPPQGQTPTSALPREHSQVNKLTPTNQDDWKTEMPTQQDIQQQNNRADQQQGKQQEQIKRGRQQQGVHHLLPYLRGAQQINNVVSSGGSGTVVKSAGTENGGTKVTFNHYSSKPQMYSGPPQLPPYHVQQSQPAQPAPVYQAPPSHYHPPTAYYQQQPPPPPPQYSTAQYNPWMMPPQ